MAFGLKYSGRYQKSGNTYKVELFKRDYVGSETEITNLMPDPVLIKRRSSGKDNNEAVVLGSELEFNFYSSAADASQFDDIYTGDWKDWQVFYYRDTTIIWQGWIQPENLTREYITDQYELRVSASDGLADLKDIEYLNFSTGVAYEDRVDILDTVKRVLNHTEIALDFKIQLGIEETLMTAGTLALSNITHDSTRLSKTTDGRTKQESCFVTLEEVLRPFGVEFFQAEGYWWIQSKSERNSNVFEYDYATLTQQSKTLTDVSIDITNYDFKNRGELQQFKPIKHHETTFQDKNLANNVIVNGDFGTNSDWTPSGLTSFNITGGEGVLVDSSGTGYIQGADFSLTSIPSNATITISWKSKNTSQTPSGDPFYSPIIVCKLFYDAVEVSPSTTSNYFLFEGAEYVTHETTFPVSIDDANYRVRFYLEKNVTLYTSVTVKIDDVVSSANWSIVGSVTTDITHRVTNDDITASSLTESEIFFGDSAQDDDLGALMKSGVRTSSWDRYGKTDGETLQVLNGLEKVVNSSAYKDYLRLHIMDVDDNIKLYERLKINSTYYRINSYTRAHNDRSLLVEIEEIITSDPTYSSSTYILDSVAGVSTTESQSSGSGAVINDAVTSNNLAWSSNKINNELNGKEDTIAANTYEPYDLAIVKSDEAETITSEWTFDRSAQNIILKGQAVGDSATPYLRYKDSAGTNLAYIGYPSASTGHLYVNNQRTGGSLILRTNDTDRMTINSAGAATFASTVLSSSTITATNFIDSSDKRLKKDVENLCNCYLKKFDKIKPIQYRLKKGDDSLQFGVIAQDIEKLYPNIVDNVEDGYKGVNYRSLAMITLAKVQAQQKEIDAIREALNRLEEKIK